MARRPHPVVSIIGAGVVGAFVAVPVWLAVGPPAAALTALTVCAACLLVDR